MKSFESEFKKYTDKVKLRASERHDLRDRLTLYMEYHPLRHTEVRPKAPVQTFSFGFGAVSLRLTPRVLSMASAAFALVVIAVPLMAQQSVPGDVLYLVKTDITEPIQAKFASSPYEKIEFETRLMERRVAEARLLAKEGRLTDIVKTQIAETVKGHSETVKGEIAALRTSDAEGAAIAQIAFASSLEVQSAVLDTGSSQGATATLMLAKVAGNDVPVDPILSVVNEARDAIANSPEVSTPSFAGLMARVERETTRAYELFAAVKKSATTEEISDIERRLEDINRLIKGAQTKNENIEEGAVMDITNALKQLKKLIFFMNDIEVRKSVALEVLVPVVLLDTERIEIARTELATLTDARASIEAAVASSTEDRAAVVEGFAALDTSLASLSAALEAGDVVAAEAIVFEAHTQLNALWALMQPPVVEDEPDTETPATEDTEATVDTEVILQGTVTPNIDVSVSATIRR